MNIDEGDRAVASIKKMARGTFTDGVLTDIGSFGAAFQLAGFRKPVLVSSADGVGTKLKVAFLAGRHDTVGEDLVNHCVNDIAVQGARPLFFLDYFAVGKLNADVAAAVISGVARGCRANGCALIGGETAEMPGLYADGEYDLAGFIVGAAERAELLTGTRIRPGDVLLALPSTGLHTNGYSLARKLLFEVAGYTAETVLAETGLAVADTLLRRASQLPAADPRADGRPPACGEPPTSPEVASPTTRRACCPRVWPFPSTPPPGGFLPCSKRCGASETFRKTTIAVRSTSGWA